MAKRLRMPTPAGDVYLEDYAGECFARVYDEVLSSDQCELILRAFRADQDGQFEGEVLGGYASDVKVSVDLRVEVRQKELPEVWDPIKDLLNRVVWETWERYLKDSPGANRLIQPFENTGFQIQQYAPERGRFGVHADSNSWESSARCGACVIYLNTIDQGGETRFPKWGVKVRAVQGRVLWFPPWTTHEHESVPSKLIPKTVISTFMGFKWPLAKTKRAK